MITVTVDLSARLNLHGGVAFNQQTQNYGIALEYRQQTRVCDLACC